MNPKTIGIYLLCVAFETCAQLLFKLSGKNSFWLWRGLVAGSLFYLCELVCWYWLLSYWPLVLALPLMGINYVTITLAGGYFFAERLTVRHLLALALIISGVTIICVRAGDLL